MQESLILDHYFILYKCYVCMSLMMGRRLKNCKTRDKKTSKGCGTLPHGERYTVSTECARDGQNNEQSRNRSKSTKVTER